MGTPACQLTSYEFSGQSPSLFTHRLNVHGLNTSRVATGRVKSAPSDSDIDVSGKFKAGVVEKNATNRTNNVT